MFFSYVGNNPRMSLFTTFFNMVLEYLDSAVRQEKVIKGMETKTKKEIELSPFADDICIHWKSQEYTKKSPRMSEFRYKNKWIKIQGNIQKLVVFVYTSSKYIETEIKTQCYITLL